LFCLRSSNHYHWFATDTLVSNAEGNDLRSWFGQEEISEECIENSPILGGSMGHARTSANDTPFLRDVEM